MEFKNEGWQVEYHWKINNQWNYLKVAAASTSHPIEKGTEQEFIAIQNWRYTRINTNQTSVYQLHHPNWLIHPVRHHKVECNMQKCMDKLLLNR